MHNTVITTGSKSEQVVGFILPEDVQASRATCTGSQVSLIRSFPVKAELLGIIHQVLAVFTKVSVLKTEKNLSSVMLSGDVALLMCSQVIQKTHICFVLA